MTQAEVQTLEWVGDNRDEVISFIGRLRCHLAFSDDERRLLRITAGPMSAVLSPGDQLVKIEGLGFIGAMRA
jgi:hypothetical protein